MSAEIQQEIELILNDILKFHSELENNKNFATGAGIRDLGLLESAVNAPFQTFGGEDLYKTIFDKAAHLAHGLAKNHGFVDGNKRVAIHAMLVLTILIWIIHKKNLFKLEWVWQTVQFRLKIYRFG